MNPFITLEQLRAIFGDAQIDGDLSQTSAGIASVIASTNNEIALYVRAQVGSSELAAEGYEMLRQPAADLARYRISGDMAKPDSVLRQRADDALKLLRSLSDRVSGSNGAFKFPLPTVPVVDDPATPEDEGSGLWMGSAPRWDRRSCRSADAWFDDTCTW